MNATNGQQQNIVFIDITPAYYTVYNSLIDCIVACGKYSEADKTLYAELTQHVVSNLITQLMDYERTKKISLDYRETIWELAETLMDFMPTTEYAHRVVLACESRLMLCLMNSVPFIGKRTITDYIFQGQYSLGIIYT